MTATFVYVDVVAAVPRYDGNTYAGRVNVFSPPEYNIILQSVDAQGTQVRNGVYLY